MRIEIRQLSAQEGETFAQLLEIFIEVHEIKDSNKLSNEEFSKMLNSENMLVLAAFDQTKPVGGLIAHIHPNHYKGGQDLYVYDIAILANNQRQGIGSKLLKMCSEICRSKDYNEMYLSAEDDDVQANNFYFKTKGEALKAIYYFYKFK